MWFELPIDSTRDALTFVELDGLTFGFRTYWNDRNKSWYMDVFDSELNPLLFGQRLGTDSLISRYLPTMPGNLILVSTDARDTSDPGRSDLGERVKLMYEAADA